jgi:hypothetical protein
MSVVPSGLNAPTGRRNAVFVFVLLGEQLVECFRRRFPTERFARSGIDCVSDGVELIAGVPAKSFFRWAAVNKKIAGNPAAWVEYKFKRDPKKRKLSYPRKSRATSFALINLMPAFFRR